MNSPFELQIDFKMSTIKCMHSLLNLKYVDIFDYVEDTVFMIKRSQVI